MSGTGARVLTAVVLIPLVVWLVLWGPTWLVAIVVAGIILLALNEFLTLGAKMNMPGYPKFTMVCALGIASAMTLRAVPWLEEAGPILGLFISLLPSPEFYLAVFLIGAASLALASKRGIAHALPAGAVSAAGLLFIALPLSYLIRIHIIKPMGLLFILVLVWAGDTAAFFVGRVMGKHLLAPVISPKKTWEGAVANVVGSLLAGAVFYMWQPERIALVHFINVAILVSVTGQIGDLFESAWKRGAGVKDSGGLLPGHGGILDRIDALLLAAPAVWWYFSIVVSWRP
jgi:phosphatidate cytidylyltransferase